MCKITRKFCKNFRVTKLVVLSWCAIFIWHHRKIHVDLGMEQNKEQEYGWLIMIYRLNGARNWWMYFLTVILKRPSSVLMLLLPFPAA